MPKTFNEAFRERGIRAEFNGNAAVVLPLTAELIEDMGGAAALARAVGSDVAPGQMLASWNEGAERHGQVLNPNAGNNLVLLVERNDGEMTRVMASNLSAAATRLVQMGHDADHDRRAVAAANAKAQDDYQAALDRGENVQAPVDQVPTYGENAFAKVPHLVTAVQEGIDSDIRDPFLDVKSRIDTFMARYELGRANSNVLSREELARVAEYRAMREEIGRLSPNNAVALRPAAEAFAGNGEVDVAGAMRRAGAHQVMPLGRATMAGANALASSVFSALTTTPVANVLGAPLSREAYQGMTQELARHQERNWSPQAIERIGQVFAAKIPGYTFDAKLFSRDGVDMLVVRDATSQGQGAAAIAYAWESASRVLEVNLNDRILSTVTREDIPTDEQMHAARVALQELRFDNGAEINFGWNDEPAAADALVGIGYDHEGNDDPETPFDDMYRGPSRD